MNTRRISKPGHYFWTSVSDYLLITFGAFLQAFAIRLFLVPGHLINSGLGGLAQQVNYYTGLTI